MDLETLALRKFQTGGSRFQGTMSQTMCSPPFDRLHPAVVARKLYTRSGPVGISPTAMSHATTPATSGAAGLDSVHVSADIPAFFASDKSNEPYPPSYDVYL
ncbi:hypothetical protein HO133_001994 [Letharia lupina]|uniref:Uncharacterized protein n=1 Tax=Letharia lupina TaxID=560253 RepID=A0A8H6CF30_9LECA|nr:uncharacterized protein HO133_001994 [Letharia lupina]KAF6222026.1 hypothetical protein HO133_001994 [Letharia lupina]